MRLGRRSQLSQVAVAVGDALRREEIRAVLTGGACASLYSGGIYQSIDVDFIVSGSVSQARLDRAMETVGFIRRGDRYVHPSARFYVEFPPGPLAIGDDLEIRPVQRRTQHGRTWMLSATDACRDRLAAYYHWNDRQSLRVAVWIAMRHRVAVSKIRRWSATEGSSAAFEEFVSELRQARKRRSRRLKSRTGPD